MESLNEAILGMMRPVIAPTMMRPVIAPTMMRGNYIEAMIEVMDNYTDDELAAYMIENKCQPELYACVHPPPIGYRLLIIALKTKPPSYIRKTLLENVELYDSTELIDELLQEVPEQCASISCQLICSNGKEIFWHFINQYLSLALKVVGITELVKYAISVSHLPSITVLYKLNDAPDAEQMIQYSLEGTSEVDTIKHIISLTQYQASFTTLKAAVKSAECFKLLFPFRISQEHTSELMEYMAVHNPALIGYMHAQGFVYSNFLELVDVGIKSKNYREATALLTYNDSVETISTYVTLRKLSAAKEAHIMACITCESLAVQHYNNYVQRRGTIPSSKILLQSTVTVIVQLALQDPMLDVTTALYIYKPVSIIRIILEARPHLHTRLLDELLTSAISYELAELIDILIKDGRANPFTRDSILIMRFGCTLNTLMQVLSSPLPIPDKLKQEVLSIALTVSDTEFEQVMPLLLADSRLCECDLNEVLIRAIDAHGIDAVIWLVKRSNVNINYNDGMPLKRALLAKGRSLVLTRLLLNHGANGKYISAEERSELPSTLRNML